MNKALVYGALCITSAIVPAIVGNLNINNEMVAMDTPAVYYDSLDIISLAVPAILSCFATKYEWTATEYEWVKNIKDVMRKGAMVAGGTAAVSLLLGESYQPIDGAFPGVYVNSHLAISLFLSSLLMHKIQRHYEDTNDIDISQ